MTMNKTLIVVAVLTGGLALLAWAVYSVLRARSAGKTDINKIVDAQNLYLSNLRSDVRTGKAAYKAARTARKPQK